MIKTTNVLKTELHPDFLSEIEGVIEKHKKLLSENEENQSEIQYTAEFVRAEQKIISEMLDKSFASSGDFIKIGDFSHFLRSEVVGITVNVNKEKEEHSIRVQLKGNSSPINLTIPFGKMSETEK